MQASPTQPATGADSSVEAVAAQLGKLTRALFLDPRADHLGLIDERDLSLTQVRILTLLACSDPEPLALGELAERLGLSLPAVSRSAESLVGRGLADRSESASDRRVRLLSITGSGHEVVEELINLRQATLRQFATSLDREQRELLGAALAAVLPTKGKPAWPHASAI